MSVAEDKLAEQRRQFEIREQRLRDQQDLNERYRARSIDVREDITSVREAGVQQRFDATQAQNRTLQTERLNAQMARAAESTAAQTARDARLFEQRRALQERQFVAADDRLTKAQAAAADRAAKAEALRRDLSNTQAMLQQRASNQQDARQARTIQAQAERLATQITAREREAEAARVQQQDLQEQRAELQLLLTNIRAEIQQARDLQQQAAQAARDQAQEARGIRAANAAYARKEITRQDVAAQKAQLEGLQRMRDAAIAALQSQLASLEQAAADQRQGVALNARLRAEADLAANTRVSGLLDSGA